MKRIRRKYYLLFWLMAGWLVASVCVNRLFAAGLINYSVLYGFVVRGWEATAQRQTAALGKIIFWRVAETALLTGICRSRLRRPGAGVFLCMVGMSAGASLVLLTWYHGIWGLPAYLLAGFCQDMCYVAAWVMIIYYYTADYEVHRGRFWSAVLFLLTCGIGAEITLSPLILKFF